LRIWLRILAVTGLLLMFLVGPTGNRGLQGEQNWCGVDTAEASVVWKVGGDCSEDQGECVDGDDGCSVGSCFRK